ncbi:5-carboxymethyl-2-hydroxymuconate Delta-isomerase [Candidatus Bandiella numerosa]|uniref:5-carboxymethyl-2-hydroxymuconate Delta-isomerase n=1 Tax=Candidatus Bandiella numerosa TaxID=2570586 RepID=UPI00249ED858|nr:5-carboxymethyl-2-hydroxymuconate Delta-isomerase [Candidatus Bandiella numerosa]WHA05051.1 5-carboxymethyl-2-hydroxymuconate Delta-isomerase [Candidatus Bandiella numerosa]
MPHIIIEYSDNVSSLVNPTKITHLAHNIMMQSGLFNAADIKSRSYVSEDYLVGEKGNKGFFVHVTVYILEGRSTLQKQNLSDALSDALQIPLEKVDQLSIDIRELAKDTYRKYVSR